MNKSDLNGHSSDAPGSIDNNPNMWKPPHAEPQQHDNPKYQAPDIEKDFEGPTMPPAVLGGAPSTGWDTEDE